jgi:CheY-like chemotaxis protein/glycine cleavage system H lipoate-binding protein
MKTKRDILVIDDEPVVLQGVARICGSEGLSVDTAPSGRAGLERLDQTAYRLILCDIMMGDLDGFEFLAEAGRRGNRAPVVMATGNSTVQNAVRSLKCGAVDYLSKPFTADELMAVVSRGLNYEALLGSGAVAPTDLRVAPAGFCLLGYMSWAVTEPVGTVLVGVSELFVRTLKGIKSIELLSVGTELVQGSGCATIVSVDGLAHEVLCPMSGQVIEAHAGVVARPSEIARDPYGAGWLYRLLPLDLEYNLGCLTPRSGASEQQILRRKGESS